MSKWLLLLLALAAIAGVVVLERAEPQLVTPKQTASPAVATMTKVPPAAPSAAPSPVPVAPATTLQTPSAVLETPVAPSIVEVPAQTPSAVAPASAAEAATKTAPDLPTVQIAPHVDPRWDGLSLAQFLDRASGDLVRLSPESVTSLGIASALGMRDDHLDSLTAGSEATYYDTVQAIVDQLATYDLSVESADARLNAEIYGAWLEDQLLERPFADSYYYVSSYMDSYPTYIEWFLTSLHPLATRDNVADYQSRLSEIPTRFRELQARLAASEEIGAVPPRFMLEQAVEQIRDTANTPPRETALYEALAAALPDVEGLEEAAASTILDQAAEVLEREVLPAYRELAEYVSGMALRASGDAGVWKQANGDAYYAVCLRTLTTTNLTADQIYDLGVAEVARIEAEIRAAAAALGFDSALTLRGIYEKLAGASGESVGEETIARCRKILEGATARIASAFRRVPTRGLEVVDGGDYAYFSPGTLDGSRPGQFFAPTATPQDVYSLPTLTYHEGIPGHGFQAAYAQEANIPPYVAGIGFTASEEGWALYAERLMWELGAYDDDAYGNLGRLQDELFRAVRLVVDPAIHAKRWTYEQAVAYMLEHTGYDEDYVRQEVERYIVVPGQAVSYKVGMLKILEVREKAKAALGDRFDLARFHDVVIGHGSLPLDLIERRVDEYVRATAPGP